MIKISYEAEFLDCEKERIFEVPRYIGLYIEYKEYIFSFSSEFKDFFSNNFLMGLAISKGDNVLYVNGEFTQTNHFGNISKEKILKKPLYKKVFLNMYKKIDKFLIRYPYNIGQYDLYTSDITEETKEEIMDIWQLIIKNIFSERKK